MGFPPSLSWAGIHWYAILGRALALGLMIMWLRNAPASGLKEEKGSGALYIITVPILLI